MQVCGSLHDQLIVNISYKYQHKTHECEKSAIKKYEQQEFYSLLNELQTVYCHCYLLVTF